MAEGDRSAQTDSLKSLTTYKDDDHGKPLQSEDSPESLASSWTVEDAYIVEELLNLDSSLSATTTGELFI